jgi:hypothetical protein
VHTCNSHASGLPLHPLFQSITNNFVASDDARRTHPAAIPCQEGVCASHSWSRDITTFLAAAAYAIISAPSFPSFPLSSSTSISKSVAESLELLISKTRLEANPALRAIIPSVEICCLFFFRAKMTSSDYAALKQEMDRFTSRIVCSAQETLMQTCESLLNAEVLNVLLQYPPPSTASGSGAQLTWAPCPLSLARITTNVPENAAAKTPSADVKEATKENGFCTLTFERVNSMVSSRFHVSFCLLHLPIHGKCVLINTRAIAFDSHLTRPSVISIFLHRLTPPVSRRVFVPGTQGSSVHVLHRVSNRLNSCTRHHYGATFVIGIVHSST